MAPACHNCLYSDQHLIWAQEVFTLCPAASLGSGGDPSPIIRLKKMFAGYPQGMLTLTRGHRKGQLPFLSVLTFARGNRGGQSEWPKSYER